MTIDQLRLVFEWAMDAGDYKFAEYLATEIRERQELKDLILERVEGV